MYCINLKKRKGKPYCKLLKKEIELSDCKSCSNKEYKKISTQSKKHKKADSERFSIITDDIKHCFVCGKPRNAFHEVFYGSYRHVSVHYGMVIPLCINHHTQGIYSAHNNRELDLKLKRLAQKIFEEKYGHDLFMKEFKIDYIEKYKEND